MADQEYIGVLDDVIVRVRPVPYGTDTFVSKIFAEGLMYGAPGLLNDGYLVQHPVLRRFLEHRDPGFLDLLERDWLKVASAIRPPSASIERRAQVGVSSHAELVSDPEWPSLAAAIDDLPGPVGGERAAWPSRDMTDGFASLAKRLHELAVNRGLPNGVDLPSSDAMVEFLEEFLQALERHHEAPRTQWEELAAQIWSIDEPVFRSMMDLANLVYHLNITMLLGADDTKSRTVVTRDSLLLAPLLGVERVVEAMSLPEVLFVDAPPVPTPAMIASVLENQELMSFRDDDGRAPTEPVAFASYLKALSKAEGAGDLLVPPISRAWIDQDQRGAYLRVTQVTVPSMAEHIRLTIPRSLCDRHAANARLFG